MCVSSVYVSSRSDKFRSLLWFSLSLDSLYFLLSLHLNRRPRRLLGVGGISQLRCSGEGAGCLGMAQMNLVTKWSDANQNRQSGRKARSWWVSVHADSQSWRQTDRQADVITGRFIFGIARWGYVSWGFKLLWTSNSCRCLLEGKCDLWSNFKLCL